MVFLVKLLSSGLGLTSEAIKAARDRSSSGQGSSADNADCSYVEVVDDATANELVRKGLAERVNDQPDKQRTTKVAEVKYSGVDQDEAVWELDDMAESVRPSPYENNMATYEAEPEVKMKMREALVQDLTAMAGPPPQTIRPLPCTVIIPQRRPRHRDRGFARAYAPVLEDCGISQDVFLEFLEDLDRVHTASKWIEVVYVAAGIIGFVPSATAAIVSAVVQVIAGTARELQMRHRGNGFLDRVNQELLMPRGLYGMVMAFKDEVPGQQQGLLSTLSSSLGMTLFAKQSVNIDETVAKQSNPDPNTSKFKKGLHDIRLVSGKTRGEIELPEAAALVYPDLDKMTAQAVEAANSGKQATGIREKLQGAGEWVNDYMDRRAHTFYEAEHPGTSLALSSENRAPLRSRFNDPNHPANSGSLIALLSGGRIPVPGADKMLSATRDQIGIKRLMGDKSSQIPQSGGLVGGYGKRAIKKVMQQDVLYLLIVNLPNEQELRESVAQLENVMKQGSPPVAS